MKKRFFEEKQRFTQWWLWLILLIPMGVAITSTLKAANGNLSDVMILIIIFGLIVVLFLIIQLRTRIDEQGIHVQLFPFHLKKVTYPWAEINSAETVKYSPIGDYGGWGIRISSQGKAFSVSGDKGIKIVTIHGKTRMIGTKQMETVNEVLANYKEKMN